MASGVLVGRGYVSIRPEFEGDWSRSVTARASSAGRSGAGAFSKAFGAGLKGIGALAGVAIGANLSSAAAGAAVLAPALATAGAAAGALKLGLSGVGEAFKAAFADSSAQASSAASATRAVESAQRGLAKAQQGLADARVQAAERIREAQRAVGDAERNLTRVVEDAAQRQKDAQRSVMDAERDLRDAQLDARQAQMSLNDARNEAVRSLQDMNDQLAGARLDEREAVMRQAEAEKALRAAQQNPGVTPEQLAKLQLAYDRATLNLKEQRRETKELATDTQKANKAGVEGSKQVTQAKDRISQANQTVADRERDLARAREEQRRTAVDSARDVADAQRQVAEAQAGVAAARREGAQQIRDAEQAVADAAAAVADAQAAAAAQTSAYAQAMAKLAPNAQAFVRAVKGLAPAWTAMRLGVQNELFKGLDTTVTSLGQATIPILQRRLTETAGVWNAIAKNAAGAVMEMAKTGMLDSILASATKNLAVFAKTPGQILTAFGQLAVAAQPAFNKLLTQFAGAITSFTDGIAKGFASGGLQEAINTAFGILSQFGTLLGNVLGVVSQIFKAAADAGGSIVGSLSAVFGELRKVLAGDEMQAQLRTLFGSVAQIVGAILPVIGAVVQAVVPLLAAIAPAVAVIAEALGPVLSQLATVLGAALMPIITALLPIVEQVGLALVQVVASLMPLLQPIATYITAVITQLSPVIQTLLGVITRVVAALVGPLSQVITALLPVVRTVGGAIGQVFTALAPFLGQLLGLLGKVAGLLAKTFATAVTAVLKAITPLIPIGLQLINTLFAALRPVLPGIAAAIQGMAAALLQLLPPMAQMWQQLVAQLVPILKQLLPVFAQIAQTLIMGLLQVLPVLVQVVTILIGALMPLLPLIGQIAGIVLKLGGDLLIALLPALSDLITAAVGILVALLPVLPPLTRMATLSLRLAAAILTKLLPPLLKLASFFLGNAVKALAAVITWMARLNTFIRSRLGPTFRWLYDKVVKPVWAAIRTVIYTTWNTGIKPTFNAVKKGVDLVRSAFRTAVTAIGKIWNELKSKTKKPISFVVNTIYPAIRGVWNKVAGLVKMPTLPEFHPKGFATGGYTGAGSKYTPAGIVHAGEYVTRKESTTRLQRTNPGALDFINRTGQLPGFDKGGIVGDVIGGISGAVQKVGGWVGDGFDLLTNPGKIWDKATGFIKDKLKRIGETRWAQAIGKLPLKMLKGLKDKLLSAATGFFGGASGSVPAALKFAKAQNGKPYRWGGVGPGGYDCSGFMSAIENVIRGQNPYRRRWATGLFPPGTSGWKRNLRAPFTVGITNAGVGHTAGTLAGVNVESRGGDGVVIGRRARGTNSSLFSSRWGFAPSLGKFDSGGWLQPGQLGYNGLSQPEAVLTSAQWNTLTAAAGRDEPTTLTGDLYLDSGEFLGTVRGVVRDEQQQLAGVLRAGRRG